MQFSKTLHSYSDSVFINCPFDRTYKQLFDAIIFTVYACGFVARCALEVSDSSENRLHKIMRIIGECQIGIHDISRIELSQECNLPRFNMSLELGMFLGAKRYGNKQQKTKVCLILDTEPYRYQKSCSDIAGQDIEFHRGDIYLGIEVVRNWLRTNTVKGSMLPGPVKIFKSYEQFSSDLPKLCESRDQDVNNLIFADYTDLIVGWLSA